MNLAFTHCQSQYQEFVNFHLTENVYQNRVLVFTFLFNVEDHVVHFITILSTDHEGVWADTEEMQRPIQSPESPFVLRTGAERQRSWRMVV